MMPPVSPFRWRGWGLFFINSFAMPPVFLISMGKAGGFFIDIKNIEMPPVSSLLWGGWGLFF